MRAYTLSFGRDTRLTSDIFFMQGNFVVVLNCESLISFYNSIFWFSKCLWQCCIYWSLSIVTSNLFL